MIEPITPATITLPITASGINIEKSEEKYKTARKFLEMGKLKMDNKPFLVNLIGEVTTQGIAENKWEDKSTGGTVTKFSLGFSFTDDEDLVNMGLFDKAVEDFCPDDYDLTNPVKDNDIIYFNIKDLKQFDTMANKKNKAIRNSQGVTVTCIVKFYMNFMDKKAGYVLHPTKYVFED
jgi:hypothetical protein